MLPGDYNTEQKGLKERIPKTAERIEELQNSISNVTRFIDKAKRYTDIKELNCELLNFFIKRIDAGESGTILQNGGAGNHNPLP